MEQIIKIGDEVGWKWLNSVATGSVIAIAPDRVEIQSKGKNIVRNGAPDNPAVTIQHKNGNLVLKLASELQVISS